MDSSEQIANGLLKLPEEQFYAEPTESLTRGLEDRLLDADYLGLAISAPTQVSITQKQELPFLMAHRRTMLRDWEMSGDRNMFLVACEANSRQVLASSLMAMPEGPGLPGRPMFIETPKPDELEQEAIVSGVRRFDARRVLELPWEPGVWKFTAVVHDWVSNTVEVELVGDKQPLPPLVPEVNPPFNPTGSTPTYLPTPESPAAPEQGVTLDIKPTDKGRILVRGTLATLAAEHQIVKWPMKHEYSGNPQRVAAVIPISLLLLRFNLEEPFQLDWAVPVYSEGEVQAGDRLEGYFTIDPLAGIEGELPGGEYAAYGVLGGMLYGPVRFTVEGTDEEEDDEEE